MKIRLNAIVLGENVAFEQHLTKTGLPYKTVATALPWPEDHALYVWIGESSSTVKEKLRKLLSAGRFKIGRAHV